MYCLMQPAMPVTALVMMSAANDNSVAAGRVTAMGRVYEYERLGVGRYRLSRGYSRGRTEIVLRGSDTEMSGTGDGLGWLTFAVRDGRLEMQR